MQSSTQPAARLIDVVKHFKTKDGIVRSVDGISIDIRDGEILALVGESGSGKSTLGRCIVGLHPPTAGEIEVQGRRFSQLSRRERYEYRRAVNMVFQDPATSLNPLHTIASAVAEPLRNFGIGSREDRRKKAVQLLGEVGLSAAMADRYPHQLSGGQRQRVNIARALALEPELLIADEPTSALDVSVQASILNLIIELQQQRSFTCLFISHNLAAVEYLADRVAVMYLGEIVEINDTKALFDNPKHPYTQALIAAAPLPDPMAQRARTSTILRGELPSPIDPPSGCRFRTRCPHAFSRCATEKPVLRAADEDTGGLVACHLGNITEHPNSVRPSSDA